MPSLIAPEEIRDLLADAPEDVRRTAKWLSEELAVSVSTIHRHAATLIERGQVTKTVASYGIRRAYYEITEEGRAASAANEGL